MLAGAAVAGLAIAGTVGLVLRERTQPAVAEVAAAAAPEPEQAVAKVIPQREPSHVRRPRVTVLTVSPDPGPIVVAAAPAPPPRVEPAVEPEPEPVVEDETVAVADVAATPPSRSAVAQAAPAAKEEPVEEPEPPKPTGPPGAFDRDAARTAMFAASGRASGCGTPSGPTGRGRAVITVSPSGSVSSVSIAPPFSGTAVGSCAAAAFRAVTLPPFTGGSMTLSKSFDIRAAAPRAEPAAEEPAAEEPKRPAPTKKRPKKRKKRSRGKHKIDLT